MNFSARQELTGFILSVSVQSLSATVLKLRYEFRNESPDTVLLFNKMWRSSPISGEMQVIPNELNIQLIDGYVLASKAMIPVPDDMEVEREYTPYQSRVGAHEIYEEVLEFSLPLTPHTCYTMPWHQLSSEQISSLPLYFELGYVVVAPEIEGHLKPIETPQGRIYTRNSSYQTQSVIRTGPVAASIPIHVL